MTRVLGDGAYGDPERPWLTRAEFDAEEPAPDADPTPAPVEDPPTPLVTDPEADAPQEES